MAFTITHTNSLFANPLYHHAIHLPELPLKQPKITRHQWLPPKSQPSEHVPLTADRDRRQQKLLEAVAQSNEELLPGVRTYDNDSARLTLVGAVDFQQAVTAAAADGGRAANEHIVAGLPTMVVETVFPGRPDDGSTLATRMFLPARKVKEKAKKLKATLSEDILSSTTSENILAMTFRQVILQQLWSFELVAFRCGTERNIEDFGNPREQVLATFTISSSEERILSVLAEVICSSALESVERRILGQSFGRASTKFIPWFHKPNRFVSKDSSVILHRLLDNEIAANAKVLLDKFSSKRVKSMGIKSKNSWWTLASDAELEKSYGPEFIAGINECIPSYRLQIDARKFKDVKVEGGNLLATNIWEILLTHSQMVCLADIIDIYYQDGFTLPAKQLSCDSMMNLSNSSRSKSSSSLLKILSAIIAGGLLLVMISILSQLYLPNLPRWRKYHKDHSVQSSCIRCTEPESLGAPQLEACCIAVIKKLKDSFDWPGEIITKSSHCAWTGELPLYLKRMMVEFDSKTSGVLSRVTLPGERIEEMKGSVQDIASYQVVLSTEGEVVGFQPTSRMAVDHWASNPLTKELYARRNLSPGFLEPGLKIHHPSEVVLLELLMSANPEPHFALVRAVGSSEMVNGQ